MEVRNCPKCGSDDIDTTTVSYEYSGSTTWSCEDCEWEYKKGRGMGKGSESRGTHPRRLSGGNQQTLTQTGEYCSECNVVIAGKHACTPAAVLAAADEDALPQDDITDALDEWHTSPHRVLREAVREGEVDLTPTFYRVTASSDEPAMFEEIEDEIARVLDETDDDEKECVSSSTLKTRLAAENDIEYAFVDRCLRELERRGRVRTRWRGYVLAGSGRE